MKNLSRLLLSLLIILVAFFTCNSANAYVLLSTTVAPKIDSPQNIYYFIDLSFGSIGKSAEVETSVNKWDPLPEIEITTKTSIVSMADVTLEYQNVYSGDTYAEYIAYSRGELIFYKKWNELATVQRSETVVHEVGHALGLDHTQSSNDSISVMREFNFNGKDYPLSDDKAGIAARY
jgi:predicted Zn-dependent protease